MPRNRQSSRKDFLWLALVGGVLIGALLLARAYSEPLSQFIEQHPFWGVFLYILLNIVDAVIAPGATLPLVPVAANAWGRRHTRGRAAAAA